MNVLLNIGLAKPDGLHMAASTALKALRERFARTHDAARLHVSDTEETIVVRYDRTLEYARGRREIERLIGFVANDLDQDCIAVLFDDPAGEPEGKLIGPRPWGEFDPTKFLLLDGTRLGNHHA